MYSSHGGCCKDRILRFRHTRWSIVADSERDIGTTRTAERRAYDSSAGNLSGTFPDNLGKVTPEVKVRHVRVGLAIQTFEIWLFVIVHEVGDHRTDVVGADTIANILAVVTTIERSSKASVSIFFSIYRLFFLKINNHDVLTCYAHKHSR
jgi:hypothetical protein